MKIDELIVELSVDPFNPELNFKCAVEYQNINQTASAISFYLRAAEYGVNTHSVIVYNSLLCMANCFADQNDRVNTVSNCILQAVAHLPERPEAYFLMSQFHERQGNWQECYAWAKMGLYVPAWEKLPADVGYHGKYVLEFEKAVSAWWIGRKEESIRILKDLNNNIEYLSTVYRQAVLDNLRKIGHSFITKLDPLEPVVMNYRKFFGEHAETVIDIGSREGDDAAYLSKALGSTKVIAIEAREEGANDIKNNYPWMVTLQVAVSDKDGEVTFHKVNSDNKELAGCSSMANKDKTMFPQDFEGIMEEIKVPCKRMDTLLSSINLNELVDVIKVDTEGFTWQVLQGFGERLKDVKLFHLETEKSPIHDDHVLTPEITAFMKDNNFFLADISYEWGPDIQDQVWVNKAHAIRCKDVFNDI
jgi:hypothetical protein